MGDQILAFDGRVLEEFGGGRKERERRLHVGLISSIDAKAASGRASVTVKATNGARIVWAGKLEDEALGQLRSLVAAVRSAAGLALPGG